MRQSTFISLITIQVLFFFFVFFSYNLNADASRDGPHSLACFLCFLITEPQKNNLKLRVAH